MSEYLIAIIQIDFPAVTVCNLNRVNCHNAFVAFYRMKIALADPTLNETQRVERYLFYFI